MIFVKTGFMKGMAVTLVSVLLLTGCGSEMPDMTEEQEKAVGEYAAMMLLRHDAGNRSRLVDLSAVEEETEGAAKEPSAESQTAETESPEASLEEGGAPSEETMAEQNPQPSEENAAASMEAFFGLPEGMTITYQGAQTCQSYPEAQDTNVYFALDAAAGKSLLVLSFDIANQTGTDADINLLQQNARYSVTVNGQTTRNALTTMLTNDMSTFMGTIPAAGSVNVVLIVEMDQEVLNGVSSISLRMKNDATTYTIQLQ